MDNDFEADLDGSMLNYSEMDSLIGLPSTERSSSFSAVLDNNENGDESHNNVGNSSGSRTLDSISNSSSSSSSKRKRKPVDPLKKKARIDYKNPFHAERLNLAITSVISSLEGEPEAFHKNIMMIAKSHNIPYNTLRDNFLRARGIEPRAHRNSERKRQADALAAAAERGVVSVAKTSTLLVQTHPASVHVAGALSRDLLKELNGGLPPLSPLPMKPGPPAPRGLALALAMAGPLGEAHAPPIGPRATAAAAVAMMPSAASAVSSTVAKADDESDDSGDDEY